MCLNFILVHFCVACNKESYCLLTGVETAVYEYFLFLFPQFSLGVAFLDIYRNNKELEICSKPANKQSCDRLGILFE